GHRHGLFDLPDAQAAVHRRRERALEDDALALEALEAGKRERNRIGAGTKVDDRVTTRAVGDAAADALDERRARRLDGDAGQHAARRILTDADDAGALLCARRYGNLAHCCRDARDDDTPPESAHGRILPAVLERERSGERSFARLPAFAPTALRRVHRSSRAVVRERRWKASRSVRLKSTGNIDNQ